MKARLPLTRAIESMLSNRVTVSLLRNHCHRPSDSYSSPLLSLPLPVSWLECAAGLAQGRSVSALPSDHRQSPPSS